ncbi:peptidase S8/S53 domain-containing protein [Gongronella butleri]|nr:peptidase S8/S53 domain-containing protein [Gongronella butleri]
MHLFPLVTLFLLAPVWARDPTRSYYTVHVPEGDTAAAQALARRLQARYEGPIGELNTYYELSAPKGHDLSATYRRLRMKRDASLLNVASVRPQVRRRKLHKRAPPPILPPASPGQMDPHTSTVIQPIILTPEIASKLYPILENFDQEYRQNTLNAMDYLKRPNGYQQLTQALSIADPGIEQQWHLINHDQPGNDLNVTGVWSQGITGKGVVVAILDDGLDMDHADLKDNFYAAGSYDFNDHTDLPRPRLEDDTHGTRCAGEIAAKKNDVCGVGVAPDAKVAGIRILSEEITEEDEARALNYKYQENDIYSCSWGPPDYGEVAEAPEGMVLDAIKNGIANGRNGTGTIYVFASGNGGGNDDNCNFDGYTNSIYTITVGAIDRLGHHPYYAERCSAQLVVAYSSGSGGNIYTTDVGNDKCTDRHGGTSAAAPLAAGVFALVLSVRPDLSWRDLQYLCVESAKPFSLEDSDWSLLPSGRMYNHKFGYGRLDAYAIVELAKTFTNVGPQSYLRLSSPPRRRPIPDRASAPMSSIRSILTISEDMMDGAGLSRLEHVTATVFIEHARRGDLEILLHSPHNITSQLGTPRRNDVSSEGLLDWTFMTVKHW